MTMGVGCNYPHEHCSILLALGPPPRSGLTLFWWQRKRILMQEKGVGGF
jgi:hypothetical protein